MIKTLEVKNFKSIRHFKLECKRVNVFIGKPNTGKSNILESIGIFSLPYLFDSTGLKGCIRLENMTNLFYDQDMEKPVEITADDLYFKMEFVNDIFQVVARKENNIIFSFNYGYNADGSRGQWGYLPVKYYKFTSTNLFIRKETDFLRPPAGENLLQILLTNKILRKLVSEIFSEYGYRIVIKPQENKIEIQKEIEDIIIALPYSLVSDTLQRIIFYLLAIETNKDSTIIFEEPEAHAFPFYTKYLAERISFNQTNQFFLSTHNPYILLSLLEKTPKDDISIFITYFKDYQTKVRPLNEKEMQEVLDLDASVFFNLDKFLELQ